MPLDNSYNEKELLRKVSEGDEQAFKELVVSHKRQLEGFVLNMTKSMLQTEEIVQDTFLQVWITREGLTSINNFPNFLFIICRNCTLNAMRNQLREKKRQHVLRDAFAGEHAYQPDDQYQSFQKILQEMVDRLPAQQKKAWELSRRQGKKYSEIADEMNLSKETIKKHIQLANSFIIDHLRLHKDVLLFIAWLIWNHPK